jgi:hypothetical protein
MKTREEQHEMVEGMRHNKEAFMFWSPEWQEWARHNWKNIKVLSVTGEPIEKINDVFLKNSVYRLTHDFQMPPEPEKERWFFNPSAKTVHTDYGEGGKLLNHCIRGVAERGWIEITAEQKAAIENNPNGYEYRPINKYEWFIGADGKMYQHKGSDGLSMFFVRVPVKVEPKQIQHEIRCDVCGAREWVGFIPKGNNKFECPGCKNYFYNQIQPEPGYKIVSLEDQERYKFPMDCTVQFTIRGGYWVDIGSGSSFWGKCNGTGIAVAVPSSYVFAEDRPVKVDPRFVEYAVYALGDLWYCDIKHAKTQSGRSLFRLHELPSIVGFAGVMFAIPEGGHTDWYFELGKYGYKNEGLPLTPIAARFYVKEQK